jgi:hypothetical protein
MERNGTALTFLPLLEEYKHRENCGGDVRDTLFCREGERASFLFEGFHAVSARPSDPSDRSENEDVRVISGNSLIADDSEFLFS